jgi:hypothetical protein
LIAFWHGSRTGLLCCAFLLLSCATALAEDTVVGFIKKAEGWGTVTHGQLTYTAAVGVPVYEGDTLRTFWNGTMGVTFKDNTRISLGPSTRVTIPKFVFSPADKQYGFVLRLLAGTMQYLSGLMAKLAPDSVKIEEPTATIGVRGTRFLTRVEP